MIIYARGGWQSLLTLRFGRGSPLTRNLLVPTLSVVMTALLFQYTCKHFIEPFAVAESGEDVGDEPVAGTCSAKWSLHPGPFTVRIVHARHHQCAACIHGIIAGTICAAR